MQFFCSGIVRSGRFFGGAKKTKKFSCAVDLDSSAPLLFESPNPLVTPDGFPLAVYRVLRDGGFSKILAAIVQRVVVAVVRFFLSTPKDSGVHSYLTATNYSASIKTLGTCSPMGVPIPLHQEVIIFRAYERVLSLREGNNLVGLVQRLYDRMSFHAFFHRLTSNELVMQPLFYHRSAT
jgi:hypothetical protein